MQRFQKFITILEHLEERELLFHQKMQLLPVTCRRTSSERHTYMYTSWLQLQRDVAMMSAMIGRGSFDPSTK